MYFCSIQKSGYSHTHLQMPPLSYVKFPCRHGPVSAFCPDHWLSVSAPRSQGPVLSMYFNTEPRFLTGQVPLFFTSAVAILALCLSIQIWGSVCQVSLQVKLNQIKYPTRIFFFMVWWLILLPPNRIPIKSYTNILDLGRTAILTIWMWMWSLPPFI